MKRFFALLLCLLLVTALAACGSSPASTPTAGNEIDTTEASNAEKEITFTEMSFYESDMFSISVTDIDPENPNGYTLNLTFANNEEPEEIVNVEYVYETNEEGESEIVDEIESIETVTSTLSCVLDSMKINGTEVAVSFSSQADSSSRNYDMIVIDPALTADLGDITEIEMSFSIYNTSTPDVAIATASGTVYPYGEIAE